MVHVWPLNDEQEHVTEGTLCPCGPVVIPAPEGELLVVHRAFDCRESVEEAARIFNDPDKYLPPGTE